MVRYARMRLIFAMLLSSAIASALDPAKAIGEYRHETWHEEQGLLHYTINTLAQTPDGYLWLGTYYGLVRFDGVTFTTFDPHNTPELGSERIWALAVDAKGTLWIGTSTGLAFYRDQAIHRFAPNGQPFDAAVKTLHAGSKGEMWVGTGAKGLYRIQDGKPEFITDPGAFIRAIAQDSSGRLWYGTSSGLHVLGDGYRQNYSTADGLPDNLVTSIYRDRAGVLWIGTRSGLVRNSGGAFTTFTVKDGLPNDFVWTVTGDRDGNLWVGTFGGGLSRLRDGKFTSLGARDGLSSQMLYSLLEDREGNLWIGTNGGGLDRLRDVTLTTYGLNEGLGSDVVLPVLQDRNGTLWVGTNGGGLASIRNGKVKNYRKADGLSEDAVWSLFEDREGGIWAGTYDSGVNLLKDGVFTTYNDKNGLSNNAVFAIAQDASGDMWFGTYGGGLNRLHAGKIAVYTTKDGLPNDQVRLIHQDRSGALWIGTRDGLSRFENGRFTNFGVKDGLASAFMLSVHEQQDGTLWFGTFGGGIARYRNGKFTTFTTAGGLFDDMVFQILEDDLGFFWMSSSKGIFRVSIADLDSLDKKQIRRLTCQSYGTADGMRGRESSSGQPGGWKSRDGRLWFGTVSGLVSVDPHRLIVNRQPPPVVIESVLVDRKEFSATGAVTVPPGSTNLEIRYTALSFPAPRRVRFRYKLEGFDKEWVDGDTRRSAFYTNLPPGSYRFRVLASNNDGVWNNQGASLDLELKPFFYQTAWFYAGVLCLLPLLAWAIYVVRVKTLIRQNHELEIRIAERTGKLAEANRDLSGMVAQLEENSWRLEASRLRAEEASRAKSDFVANISHEIRTPMNGILGMTGLALGTPLNPEQREYLELVKTSADALLILLNDVLDFSKIEAGHLALDRLCFSLRRCVHDALGALASKAVEKHLEIDCEIDPSSPDMIVGDRGRLRQVLLNLIGNAVKFTGYGRIKVSVQCRSVQNGTAGLQFSVSDTGIGIPADQHEVIFEAFRQARGGGPRDPGGTGLGLAICARLVSLMGGRIWVESEPGRGSTFAFHVPFEISAEQQRVAGHMLPPAIQEPVRAGAPAGGLRILLAEDNLINQRLAATLLSKRGHKVHVVSNGVLALKALADQDFDLILMDVQMPEMDGLETVRRIRELERPGGARIPVLAMTAYAMRGDREKCIEAGMDAYIAKPIHARQLEETIASLMGDRMKN